MSLNLGIIASSRTTAASLLLDTYTGAATAYSLRKLRTAYTGAAIRVRRSSDNTETDIGFSGGGLDTTALTTFVGAGNGFVTKWYDQSGNARDVGQGTNANQPIIVLSGTVYTVNSKPAVLFNGTSTELRTSTIASWLTATPYTFILVDRVNTIKVDNYFCGTSGVSGLTDRAIIVGYRNGSQVTLAQYNDDANFSFTQVQQQRLHNIYFKFPNSEYFINNTSLGTQTNPANGANITDGGFQIGRAYGEGALYYNGYLQEVIAYPSNQLTNRTGINTNINLYYSIYWQGNGNALLDLYPSAAAAYSLRNLSSTYFGPLVRVRRSSDNTEQDIYGIYTGVLDSASLLAFCGVGDGFISIWYDQSGKGFNATQTTTANQPQIVSSGVIILNNSKPSVQFNGTSQVMSQAINFTGGNYYTFTSALSANVQTGYRGIFAIQFASSFGFTAYSNLTTANKWGGYQVYTTPNEQPANSSFQGAGMTLIGMRGFANQEANSSLFYKNNASDGTYNNSVGQIGHIGGLAGASQHLSGKISEIVVWNYLVVGNAPNISGINSNINSYYTIY